MALSASLSLQAILKAAATRAGMTAPARRVHGLSDGAAALCVAGAAARDRAVVLVVPDDAQVERATTDIRFFLGVLEGLSSDVAERVVLPFPSPQVDPYRGLAPHLLVASARARALHALAAGKVRIVVASGPALLPRLAEQERLLRASTVLKPGDDVPLDELAALLVDAGFTHEDPVDEHGEFCIRGGIVDVYPASDAQPTRLEFVGDTIESIRAFDSGTQRSIATLDQLTIIPLREQFTVGPDAGPGVSLDELTGPADDEADSPGPESNGARACTFFDYLPSATRVFVSDLSEVQSRTARAFDQAATAYTDAAEASFDPPEAVYLPWSDIERVLGELAVVRLDPLGLDDDPDVTPGDATVRQVRCQPVLEFHGRIGDWVEEIRRASAAGETVVFVAEKPGRADRTVELLAEYGLRAVRLDQESDHYGAAVLTTVGRLSRGFRLPGASLQLFAETDVFEEERGRGGRRQSLAKTFLSDLRDLKPGDLIVHVDHGIGLFTGLQQIAAGPGDEAQQEFIELRYAGDDKLYVPVERLDLVQKYTGAARPPLDRLGGTSWERAKTRVRKAMRDMAGELLKLYASRQATTGHAFSPDTHWQQEFDDAFEYELTPDQVTAVADIKHDMEQPVPMDRLLCGDVGYGKTEVAMRAAFKAVMDGKQVAVLAPTTILAFQHAKTLRERWAAFPVRIDMVSRFRSRAEQTETLRDLAAGRVDIIVGTHRLLSKDVKFRDLGLLVVDEEQRFGVAHKERIKQLRRQVDVLTMSATPIPRTLNMSLMGIRDMSIIETPPKDRLSIQTNVVKFDSGVIGRAIRNELARGGQVYFVHNRVESIFSIGHLITRLVPEARVVVAHGQMAEDELERAMLAFVEHRHDVLLATTIIENGLDIPNVNTIVINRADRYGLAQLYQLRGRVGRSDRPAYAYLLIPPEDSLSVVAKRRLAAIKEFSDLGSGFRVAALDLEIRGAGTLLGGEQSGHIESVGFEMYMKLLEQTVRELKGEPVDEAVRATVNLGVDLRIDDEYVPHMNQRLSLYRRIASAHDLDELQQTLAEITDRYGAPPPSVLQLVDYGRIRILADRLGIESVDRDRQTVSLKFRPQARIDPTRLVSLVSQRSELSLLPPVTLKLDLAEAAAPAPRRRGGGGRRPGRDRRDGEDSQSWWTQRARTGRVEPGFSRDEILKPAKTDPRGPRGVLTLTGELLAVLAAGR